MEHNNKYSLKDIIQIIVWIIICHCLGDYFFQTEYLAINKGKDNYCLFVHCVNYCVPFILVFGLSLKILFIFIVHIIEDAGKARYNITSVYTDQIIHYCAAFVFLYKYWENYGFLNLMMEKQKEKLLDDEKKFIKIDGKK